MQPWKASRVSFCNLLTDSLLDQSIDQVGGFIKNSFDMVGQDLVTEVSILSNSQPQDVIERPSKTILELTGFIDVFDLASKYGLSASTATKIAVRLFQVPVISPISRSIGSPIGGPARIPIGLLIGIPII